MKQITIVGAGLTGCLLAISLAQKNFAIRLIESRGDIRLLDKAEGRSINLAISERGLHALDQVGLKQQVLQITVPVLGRMMHDLEGKLTSQRYGRHDGEHNYSLSRFELNKLLLDNVARYNNVTIEFNQRIDDIDLSSDECVIGCDGANSAIRESLKNQGIVDYEKTTYPHAYKEIQLAKGSGLDLNHLHIWPRGDIMLMALANHDGSFTCTLYCRHAVFATLSDKQAILEFFNQHFPDFIDKVPDLADQFMANPTGHLVTVKTAPWHYQDQVLLLGDAAHAMVPFLGQGMNCGFEDITLLNQCIAQQGDNWQHLFEQFYQDRKIDADAITQMAQENYHEMSSAVADPQFLRQKQLEQQLMQKFPNEYLSKYVIISYTNLPYRQALTAGSDPKIQKLIKQLEQEID